MAPELSAIETVRLTVSGWNRLAMKGCGPEPWSKVPAMIAGIVDGGNGAAAEPGGIVDLGEGVAGAVVDEPDLVIAAVEVIAEDLGLAH